MQALISGIFRHQATITLVLTMRNVQCLKQCIEMHQATITIVLTKVVLFAMWQVVERCGTVVLCGSDNHWLSERNQRAKHSSQRMLISSLLQL